MKSHHLLTTFIALCLSACSDRRSEEIGRVDDWTWQSNNLKACTSPNKERRVRADIMDGQIELKFGAAGEHPVDIEVQHTELIPEARQSPWSMECTDDETFVFDHPLLGRKIWTIHGTYPMKVTVRSDWQRADP